MFTVLLDNRGRLAPAPAAFVPLTQVSVLCSCESLGKDLVWPVTIPGTVAV